MALERVTSFFFQPNNFSVEKSRQRKGFLAFGPKSFLEVAIRAKWLPLGLRLKWYRLVAERTWAWDNGNPIRKLKI